MKIKCLAAETLAIWPLCDAERPSVCNHGAETQASIAWLPVFMLMLSLWFCRAYVRKASRWGQGQCTQTPKMSRLAATAPEPRPSPAVVIWGFGEDRAALNQHLLALLSGLCSAVVSLTFLFFDTTYLVRMWWEVSETVCRRTGHLLPVSWNNPATPTLAQGNSGVGVSGDCVSGMKWSLYLSGGWGMCQRWGRDSFLSALEMHSSFLDFWKQVTLAPAWLQMITTGPCPEWTQRSVTEDAFLGSVLWVSFQAVIASAHEVPPGQLLSSAQFSSVRILHE